MRDWHRKYRAAAAAFAALVAIAVIAPSAPTFAQQAAGPVTHLPLPRFMSLKSAEVNVRGGPGRDHEILWTYVRQGYPIEVIQEFDIWRRIRDVNGDTGWILGELLSSVRTAVVRDVNGEDTVPLRSAATLTASVVAHLQPGVQATVERCTGGWCRLTDPRFTGWIEQDLLWGVYPGEEFD